MDVQTMSAGPAGGAGSAEIDGGDHRALFHFTVIALPVGWVMLSIPLLLGVAEEPFVLATLFIGLVAPAVVLTRRDPAASAKQLLRDTARPPRPVWMLLPAVLLIPASTVAAGAALGAQENLSASSLADLALANVAPSLLIVNLWEEMAWTGFVQRRAMARWSFVGGSLVTALLFTGVHLPMSLYDARSPGDVAYNVAAMLGTAVGLRLLIGALDRWGRRSILAIGLLHATFNASSELVDTEHDWVRYVVTGALGLVSAALVLTTSARRERR